MRILVGSAKLNFGLVIQIKATVRPNLLQIREPLNLSIDVSEPHKVFFLVNKALKCSANRRIS